MVTDKSIYYPRMMRVTANAIRVCRGDDGYQRDAQAKKIENICKNYNKYIVNPVKVYMNLGTFWAFDGQNTLEALKKIFGSDCEVPVLVYEINDVEAAELFELQTGFSSKPTISDKFKSKVFREDEDTEKIISICKNYGFTIDIKSKRSESNFRCIGEIESFYKDFGKYKFEEAIRIIHDCWAGEDACTCTEIFKGVSQFISRFDGKYSESFLKKKLSKLTARTLRNRVNEGKKNYGANRYIITVIDEYNKCLIGKNRLSI